MTTVILENGKKFHIKTEHLKKNSDYFSAVLRTDSEWMEANGVVRLEEVEDAVFTVFKIWTETGEVDVDWVLYLRTRTHTQTNIIVGNKESVAKVSLKMAKLELLLNCHVLGDYLQAHAFQNAVMDQIVQSYKDTYYWTESQIPLHNIEFICERTYAGTPLRGLIIDILSSCLSSGTWVEACKLGLIPAEVSEAVAADFMGRSAEQSVPMLPWNLADGHYHVYTAAEARQKEEMENQNPWKQPAAWEVVAGSAQSGTW